MKENNRAQHKKRHHDLSMNMGKRARNKLFGVIYSRVAVILLLLLLQIGLMMFVLTYLEAYSNYMYGVYIILTAVAVIYIINDEGNPEMKQTWLLFVLTVPVAGVGFYIFRKIEPGTVMIRKRLDVLSMETDHYLKQDENVMAVLKSSRHSHSNLAGYLYKQVGFPVYGNTKAVYFPLGDDQFPVMLSELKKARKFIFMEYFIVEEGVMWNAVLDVLREKVSEGVEVRFMYDGMCSLTLLPYNYPDILMSMGIQCKQFEPIKPILSTSQNNRDHRKICVIDGKVAFTGGINLADEYINRKERFGHWKDTGIMLKGEAVESFTMMFLEMWNLTERRPENYGKYVTSGHHTFRRDDGYMIPYADNPYNHEAVGEEIYFHILNHARKYVHIMTPYLILDNDMIKTLKRAAKSGIEVKIIMPHIPDKPYAFYLAKTYFGELISSGVQIYEYTPGFVHAKVFVADDDTATVGTVNLDYRSLYLHFECGVFIYRNPVVHSIERDFQETLKKCRKVTMLEVRNRSLFVQIYGQILRLVAPLL